MKMQVIYKHQLKIVDEQVLTVGSNAKILSAQEQDDKLVIWVMQDALSEPEYLRVKIVGTGNNCDVSGFEFLDTVQMYNRLVWHVFYKY